MAVETLRPSAPGNETAIEAQFPDTGEAHWENVDEISADDGSTTVLNETNSYQRDLYNLPASSGSGTINKITVFFRCGSGLGTSGAKAKASIRSNSTITDGDEESLAAGSFDTFSMEWATNPADSQPWGSGWSVIDNLQIGVSLKSGTSGTTPRAYCTQVYVVVHYAGIITAEKRRSISGIMIPLMPGVTPNASKDSEWRQQSGWSYSGIAVTKIGFPGAFMYYQRMRRN